MHGIINIDLAKEKGLIKEDDSLYKKLVKNYKYLLEYFLDTTIDFKKYENSINNCNLYIGKNTKHQNMNEYLKLDYLVLINNLFIEKLDINDINLLMNFNRNNINDEMLSMIKKTFKEIIKDNYFKGNYVDNIYNVCYGPMVPYNFASNNSLVFRFYYGKNTMHFDNQEYIELDKKQREYINQEMELLKKEILTKLDVNCEILIEKDIN